MSKTDSGNQTETSGEIINLLKLPVHSDEMNSLQTDYIEPLRDAVLKYMKSIGKEIFRYVFFTIPLSFSTLRYPPLFFNYFF